MDSNCIDMVVSMLSTEFDRVYVMDQDLRRRLVGRMLDDEDFVGEALGKYELDELLRGGDSFAEVLADEQPRTITLEMHLSGTEQLMLAKNNRDVRLLFEPGAVLSHAMAAAQRIVDTDRCLRCISHYGGEIMDIGGNYAAHARQCRVVHSCTLLNSVREQHRQTERMANLDAAGINMDRLDMCTVGAQTCLHQAVQSMSVHAIQDIPYEDWPNIMDRHGLTYHVAVFHYDPIMLTVPHGKLDGGYMYYEIVSEDVTFYFESDASFGYTHNWKNYKKYIAPWCQFSTTTEWAYLYDIKSVQGGICTAEIVRVPQTDLGIQVSRPAFAYVPMEDKKSVSTYMYDINSGLDSSNPAAFFPVDLMVDKEMFNFLYMYGLSNDTANPNRPMTIDEFRAMGRTYNQTRRFGDASISGQRKIPSLTAYDVYDAIYHVVCHERALLSARAAALTSAMVSKQRVVELPAWYVSVMFPVCAIGATLVAPGKVFEYYFSKFAELWKDYLSGKLKAASAAEVTSYVPLEVNGYTDIDGFHPANKFAFERPMGNELQKHLSFDEADSVHKALFTLATAEDDDNKSFLDNIALTNDAADTLVNPASAVSPYKPFLLRRSVSDQVDLDEDQRDVFHESAMSVMTSDSVNSDYRTDQAGLIGQYKALVNTSSPIKFDCNIEPDTSRLHDGAHSAMIEYAVYCYDVGHGIISTLRRIAQLVCPAGTPNSARIDNANNGEDIGVRVIQCVATNLPTYAVKYAIGVDPLTSKVHIIRKRKDGSVGIDDQAVSVLVTTDAVRVFNSFAIAQGMLRSIKNKPIFKFEMSLINGVPGCGKTSEIVREFTIDDVVLCAVRHSKDDTLARLMAQPKHKSHVEQLRLRVRTLDSVIMHGFRDVGAVKVVHVDEGLMAFPGQLYGALEKLRPRSVKVYGDQHQIKAIDRSPSLGKLIHRGIAKWTSVENRDVSHSMPADVAVLLAKHVYGRKIYTTSPVMRSLFVHKHKSPTEEVFVTGVPGWDYLSVLTADKAKLLNGFNFVDGKKLLETAIEDGTGKVTVDNKNAQVFTVHEAQGQRLSRTAIVRMNMNTSAVLNSVEHVVVALSRHYYKCDYHSLGEGDLLWKIASDHVTDDELRLVMQPSSAESVVRIQRLSAGALQ